MGFLTILSGMANSLGMTESNLILLIIFFVGFVFLALDLKVGMFFYILSFGASYILFTFAGFSTIEVLVGLMLSILILTINLYSGYQKTSVGGLY